MPRANDWQDAVSNDDTQFSWKVAGSRSIDGDTTDYEAHPPRDLSDSDIQDIRQMVVAFRDSDGNLSYTTLIGPWDDWDELEQDIAEWWESGS